MHDRRDAATAAATPPRRDAAARLVALATVATFVCYPWTGRLERLGITLDLLALLSLTAVIVLRDGDISRLGLRLHPIQGWPHWCRLALRIGLVVAAILFVWTGLIYAIPIPVTIPRIRPAQHVWMFVWMCIRAPLIEELVFRSLLAVAVQPTLGDRGTIFAGGLLFALMHILGGNPSPENQIGGFLLMWTFLRSGSILVPMSWHAAGNVFAFGAQVANWYVLPGNPA